MAHMVRIKTWAKRLKRDILALWLAARDRRVPWHAKLVSAMVAAYALSPIDLIPDFVPILGYLDDLLIVPLGILLAVRLIPRRLMVEFRREALRRGGWRPKSWTGLIFILAIWAACLIFLGLWLRQSR